jgi:prepilin-type N-terminal cleavage/methylation domain-containing protein
MTFPKRTRSRPGFTLVETIVTVGLLAVLAAFIVPTIVQKAGAAEPVKVINDLSAIRTGLETFISDVGAYPNQLHMLTDKPTTSNHFVDSVTALTGGQVLSWNGPYLSATVGTLVTDTVSTGFGAYIKNFISLYDAQNNAAQRYVAGTGTGGTFNPNNTLFVALTIVGITKQQAFIINRSIDGTSDLDVATGAYTGANVTGRFRHDVPDANNQVVAYYLASPVAK